MALSKITYPRPCSRCREVKEASEFFPRPDREGARQSHCKECNRARNRTPQAREWQRRQREKHRAKRLPEMRDRRLMRLYGLTPEEHNAMEAAQNSLCAICNRPERLKGGRRLSIDHCHSTGAIRGLLCSRCNTAIGSFDDNIELMRRAIEYLQR